MFRIRKITDYSSPADQNAIAEVQAIVRQQFPGIPESQVSKLPEQLANPFEQGFVASLFLVETAAGRIRAFALLLSDLDLKFAFLDLISTAPGRSGGGLGAALYERIREEALAGEVHGIYFECLPDDSALSPDPEIRKQNAARLRFYERFGARVILGTLYETPVEAGTIDSPYLVFDGLGCYTLPETDHLKEIVRAILDRKYADHCPPDYIDRVIGSIRPDTLRLREPVRKHKKACSSDRSTPEAAIRIPLIVNAKHDIHHIRERGYVEAPVRINSILAELNRMDLFDRIEPRSFEDEHIRAVHDGGLVDYIENACRDAPKGKSVYPYVFPIRNADRKPTDESVLAGYWCIDTFTPINTNAYPAARGAVDCALTAADDVLNGKRIAYALVRPPGHHAEHRVFGGFCYFNNAAIAAHYLSRQGGIAVLDIDYHHGNGTQDIFYDRSDVLTVSIHGHPSFAYPYFTGFADETGIGRGAGYNLNLPLAETITADDHRAAVRKALDRIDLFDPAFLVLAIGFDTGKGDPTGTWPNRADDFERLGRMIGETGYPIVAIQEGGYRVRTLGVNARRFFHGLAEAISKTDRRTHRPLPAPRPESPLPILWRETVIEEDIKAVKSLVESTGMFTAEEVDIAAELVSERIAKGPLSGYEFVMAESEEQLLGYACYGRVSGTDCAFDLYWIAVDPRSQRHGLGRAILDLVETRVAILGGGQIYVDTSSTDKYRATRRFYERSGFRVISQLPDFYREGDAKVILAKCIHERTTTRAAS